MIALAQRANLETREAKHEPRSLAEQRATWRGQAEQVLGAGGVDGMLAAVFWPVAVRPSEGKMPSERAVDRWWGGRGSNPRPRDYESPALTG